MAILSTAAGWLVMSIQLVCPPIPFSEGEAEEIAKLAREIVPTRLQTQEFEKSAVSKCAITAQLEGGVQRRVETVKYKGSFRDKSQVVDTSIREIVVCRVSVTSRNRAVIKIDRSCNLGIETRLVFDGIEQEIEIPEGVLVEDVRQFLTYLSRQIGSFVDGRVFTAKEFSQISSIMGNSSRSRKYISAVYESGCSSSWLKATATGDSVLEFSKLKRRGAIC